MGEQSENITLQQEENCLLPRSFENNASYSPELTLLASALLYKTVMCNINERLLPEDFTNRTFQNIFVAMKNLFDSNIDINPLTIENKLIETGHSEKSTEQFLIHDSIIATKYTNVDSLIDILLELTTRRKSIVLANKLSTQLQQNDGKIGDILADINNQLIEINADRSPDITHMSQLKDITPKDLANPAKYHRTLFTDLDKLIRGMRNSRYHILGARTSKGKTSLALQIACNIARMENVLFITLEMKKE